jgi:exopolysaccharide production protein ExoQ
MRTLIVASLIVFGLAAGLLLFGLFQFDAMDAVLHSFGKDSTLTGRTFIWAWGHRILDEHPWTGVGASGFWRPDVGVANQILTFFFYQEFVKFSFHNSYLENGVQLGYPGFYATAFLAAWGVWNAVRTWIKSQTLFNFTFLVFGIMIVIRSQTEIDLALELGATAVLFFIGAARKENLRASRTQPSATSRTARAGWRNI